LHAEFNLSRAERKTVLNQKFGLLVCNGDVTTAIQVAYGRWGSFDLASYLINVSCSSVPAFGL
jgi:hypothetical protein